MSNISLSRMKRNETRVAWLFLTPSLIGFTVFMLIPLLFSVILSFSKWDMISGIQNIRLIGFGNFIDLMSDENFKKSVVNNFLISVVTVPVTIILALILAVLLNRRIYARGLIRTMMFVPYVCILTAVCAVFMAIFNRDFGPINNFLRSLGMSNPPGWIGDLNWALPSIMILWFWRYLGYFVLIFIAGLQSISSSHYESAEIDGGNSFDKFFHITLPLVSPTTLFLMITGLIASFQVFPEVKIMTNGGPGNATYTLIFDLYTNGFTYLKMGYANAVAMVYFFIVITITIIQWKLQNKWVHY